MSKPGNTVGIGSLTLNVPLDIIFWTSLDQEKVAIALTHSSGEARSVYVP